MGFLGEEFTTDTLPESTGFDPLPIGWYSATIEEAGVQPTKSGTGEYIKLKWAVTGPTHQGRIVFENINHRNASAKAEEIGRSQLGEVLRAIGLARVTDSDQLVGGSAMLKLGIEKNPEHGDKNKVLQHKALDAGGAPAVSPTASATPAPAKATGSKPPWAK